jgi:hypothetical protein
MTPRYNVSYAAYIPVDHVAAVSTCQFLLANVPVDVAGKIYLGDANKGTYRASEALIVSVDAQSHGSLFYAPSETRNYGAGSPANGYSANLSSTVVTPGVYMVSGGTYAGADEDGVANDCHFWNAYGWADNSSMNGLGVAYPTSTQEQVNFYGSGSNPLEVPLAQIRWNMTVTIDDSTPSAPWAAVDYTLSCYPAHIVKVNGVTVYDSQSSTPKIPSSNGAGEISYCLTSTVGQQTGSGPKVAVPPN